VFGIAIPKYIIKVKILRQDHSKMQQRPKNTYCKCMKMKIQIPIEKYTLILHVPQVNYTDKNKNYAEEL